MPLLRPGRSTPKIDALLPANSSPGTSAPWASAPGTSAPGTRSTLETGSTSRSGTTSRSGSTSRIGSTSRLALISGLAAGVLLLSACGSTGTDTNADTATGDSSSAAGSAASPAVEAPAPDPSPAPSAVLSAAPESSAGQDGASATGADAVVDLTLDKGTVTGTDGKLDVPVGTAVLVRLTSDISEEVHVHGYDLHADVPAGGTGEVQFDADIPGSFEVELEGSGRLLFQLQVS